MTALYDGIILHAELKKSEEALELAKKSLESYALGY